MQVYIQATVLLALIVSGSALQCYECNVWKAGYGNMCIDPRLRNDCVGCIKIETNIWMGYYKNSPRHSQIVTKVCSKSKTIHFGNECHTYAMSDGTSTRCYCDTDKCNSASGLSLSTWIPLSVGLVLSLLQRCW